MTNEKLPERIWLIENNDPEATTETEILWSSAPSDAENDLNIEYVRADLLATVRGEERSAAYSAIVNNVAAVLNADDVEAFTALIMKAMQSPDLNSETRSALKSEAEIRAEEREAAFTAIGVELRRYGANIRKVDLLARFQELFREMEAEVSLTEK